MNTTCIRCKFYRIQDANSGFCRVEVLASGNRQIERPIVLSDHHCEKWKDCGQTYYIRLGWIKSMDKENGDRSS